MVSPVHLDEHSRRVGCLVFYRHESCHPAAPPKCRLAARYPTAEQPAERM